MRTWQYGAYHHHRHHHHHALDGSLNSRSETHTCTCAHTLTQSGTLTRSEGLFDNDLYSEYRFSVSPVVNGDETWKTKYFTYSKVTTKAIVVDYMAPGFASSAYALNGETAGTFVARLHEVDADNSNDKLYDKLVTMDSADGTHTIEFFGYDAGKVHMYYCRLYTVYYINVYGINIYTPEYIYI